MDDQETQWSDAQLLVFLNKAYDYVQRLLVTIKSELAITSANITMVAATQEYSLATSLPDFWAMSEGGVTVSGIGTPLIPGTYEDKLRSAGAATNTYPVSYYVTATDLGVLDIPSATAIALYNTLTCRYYKRGADLALATAMPYKNILNEPMSTFMDGLAMIKAEMPGQELTALHNALEQATMGIIKDRTPL
jgi:hypothetical protein